MKNNYNYKLDIKFRNESYTLVFPEYWLMKEAALAYTSKCYSDEITIYVMEDFGNGFETTATLRGVL